MSDLGILAEPTSNKNDPLRPTLILPGLRKNTPTFRQRILADKSRRPTVETIQAAVGSATRSLGHLIEIRQLTVRDYTRYAEEQFGQQCSARRKQAESALIKFFQDRMIVDGTGWVAWSSSDDFKSLYEQVMRALIAPLDLVIEALEGASESEITRRKGAGRPPLRNAEKIAERLRELYQSKGRPSNANVLLFAKSDPECLALVGGNADPINIYRVQAALKPLRNPKHASDASAAEGS